MAQQRENLGNRDQALEHRTEIIAELDENRKHVPYDMYDVDEFDAWVLDPHSVGEVHRTHFDGMSWHGRVLIDRMGLIRSLKALDDHLESIEHGLKPAFELDSVHHSTNVH